MAGPSDILTRWQLPNPYLAGGALLSKITGISQNAITSQIRKLKLTKATSAGALARPRRIGGPGRPPIAVRNSDAMRECYGKVMRTEIRERAERLLRCINQHQLVRRRQ
jgi:hypothetical protein